MKSRLHKIAIQAVSVTALIAIATTGTAIAKDDPKKKDAAKPKTIAELKKDKTLHDGFLKFYQDEKTGSLMLLISKDDLNKPMLHASHTMNGVADAGHFTGSFRSEKLVEFTKSFDKIELVTKTNRFKFDETSAISRAKDANISKAILATLKIEGTNKDQTEFMVKADTFLLSEALDKLIYTPHPDDKDAKKRFNPGKLSKDKNKYVSLRSYPENSDVVVEYVLENPAPAIRGSSSVSDSRSIVIEMQHSFIKLPESDFQARRDDPRIGYFHQQFDVMTSNRYANYGDVINRWNLVKKDPSAALSEPVKPITWWIENTTPVELRETIKEATLAWNEAFETAGFKNAIEVKIQPDDAEWDAGDIRYNVLRWTSSPRPFFGGYGPSLANPMTGEIIAADIMLELVFIKNRWLYEGLFTEGLTMQQMMADNIAGATQCSAGHSMQMQTLLASTILETAGASEDEMRKMMKQSLSGLILHEVGHTLGLNHNMRASQRFNATEVHDAAITQGVLTGSVMDYAPTNIAPPGVQQGDYSDYRAGPYDHWAIEYGYSTGLADAEKEESRLSAILVRSTQPDLAFGNDADDMRSPGRHIDPRVMTNDMSNQAIDYSIGRIKLVNDTFGKLKDRVLKQGDSYHNLVMGTNVLIGNYRAATGVMTRYIGGVYIDRALVGQENATQPYQPVPKELQKQAMGALGEHLFAANVFDQAKQVYSSLQVQRRGFNNYGKNEDPKIHATLLNIQKNALAHLLHKDVLTRMSDTAMYGNEYRLNEMLSDLTSAVFDADLKSEVNTHRQNLQIEYVQTLLKAIDKKSPYDHLSKAAITYQLNSIARKLSFTGAKGDSWIHQSYLKTMIDKAVQG
jgi:hypothetical protein